MECKNCGHSTPRWRKHYGCGIMLSSGPCNSDYSYCKCKNTFHGPGRCTELYNNTQCTNEVLSNDKCSIHLDKLSRLKVEYEQELAFQAYTIKKQKEKLEREINQAICLLRDNGYHVWKQERLPNIEVSNDANQI